MNLEETVQDWISEILDESKFLVDLKISNGNKKITAIIDGDEGVTIDDCAGLSRELGVRLDELLDNSHTIEVTSPGLDQPLLLDRQYRKNKGRLVKVKLLSGDKKKGILKDINDEAFYIDEEKSKKLEEINFKDIEWTKVQVSFK